MDLEAALAKFAEEIERRKYPYECSVLDTDGTVTVLARGERYHPALPNIELRIVDPADYYGSTRNAEATDRSS